MDIYVLNMYSLGMTKMYTEFGDVLFIIYKHDRHAILNVYNHDLEEKHT